MKEGLNEYRNKSKTSAPEKGYTQEQLAVIFGVSPQAVSRWENDTAYPDITMLPGMANFYGVTVDELLGMEDLRSEQHIAKIHRKVHRLTAEGKMENAVILLRESLKLYPNDSGLLIALCETLTTMNTETAAKEAIVIGEQVLKNGDVSLKAKTTVTVTLIFLYEKCGLPQKAAEAAASLPHIWGSRELLIPELSDNRTYKAELGRALRQTLALFSHKIEASDSKTYGAMPQYIQLGFDFDEEFDIGGTLLRIGEFLTAE